MKKSLFLIVSAFMLASCGTPQVEVCKYKDDLQAAVSLTFDDGLIDDYTLIAPCLDSLGLKGTFWVIGNNIGQIENRLTWEQCRRLSSSGHKISNHSWTHPDDSSQFVVTARRFFSPRLQGLSSYGHTLSILYLPDLPRMIRIVIGL